MREWESWRGNLGEAGSASIRGYEWMAVVVLNIDAFGEGMCC